MGLGVNGLTPLLSSLTPPSGPVNGDTSVTFRDSEFVEWSEFLNIVNVNYADDTFPRMWCLTAMHSLHFSFVHYN
jgi:hypothetical protein